MFRKIHHFPLVCILLTLIVMACASPGTPDGGPYDETPPRFVGATPKYGALKAKSQTIELYFDEYIKVENATENVIISPTQIETPEISSSGRKIKVKLLDSLKENTTYTIDFSDAIVDNNESNPLGKFAFVFSTGDVADSMEVSGKVLNAQNLEPIKGIMVGLHSDTTDSAFQTIPLQRIARTNGSGEFTIKGVKPGKYKAYALQDADGNYTFSQPSEMIAFMKDQFETGQYPDIRHDTIWHDSIYYDSILTVPYTHYTPDNLVLLAYLESKQDRHLLKSERSAPEHFEIYFTASSEETPRLKGLNFDEQTALLLHRSVGNDTLSYWITDTALVHQDTLLATCTYLDTDTIGVLVEKTDTMEFVSKIPRAKQLKLEAEQLKKWTKEQEKKKKKGLPYLKKKPIDPLDVVFTGNKSLAPDENVQLATKIPVNQIDTSLIHLYLKKDSTYVQAPYVLERHPLSPLHTTIYAEWRPKQEYQLLIDSAAFVSIYGSPSKQTKIPITIPSLDSYGSLFLNLKGINDTTAIVELLNNTDKAVRATRSKDGRAEFYFLKPGVYFLRMFIDKNGNNKWDPGDYAQGILPEETYYYNAKLNIRALWDMEQDWDIHRLPLSEQKPMEITKQKPDKEKTIKHRNAEREQKKRK